MIPDTNPVKLSEEIRQKQCEARNYPGPMIADAWDATLEAWIALAEQLEAKGHGTGWSDKDGPTFGDYVIIEMKRYGVLNERYTHKVINRRSSNAWVDVPVQSPAKEILHDEMADVIGCVCEGVGESEILSYRVRDVKMGEGSFRQFAGEQAGEEIREALLEALKAVVRVADRKTVEFDAARAAIAKYSQP